MNLLLLLKSSYIPSDKHAAYVSTTQRQNAIWRILENTNFGSVDRGEIGINRLIKENVFLAAYPPHDGHYAVDEEDETNREAPDNPRAFLYESWARFSKWHKLQPLEKIKEYCNIQYAQTALPCNKLKLFVNSFFCTNLSFNAKQVGEKIGFYFAWLGAYNTWLLLPSIIGLLVFVAGFLSINQDVTS